ncbi:DNA (cytosine-5-)-methyltransferase [Edaphobacter sp. 12200R-103]|uniref:DNA (cytosine-5-)-methyltransferase n=1 Tax=Edaphobacter sp. 12200R-103 TaxID=2703788 RepID=UPI00138BC18A|nr:DNA (cytosine-5-)-methyltransferase [Edaphobacter sp. 12200R-103]QHS52367.1 DNA (cytosine-5-)-methyltransferase [Edaphobacter sp. 12200R-103]
MPSESLSNLTSEPLALLAQVRQRMTQREIGKRLQVDPKTVGRWERRETDCPKYVQAALREMLPMRGRPEAPGNFTFIDLFAGIGGMRKGFESAGGHCIFTSEWNEWSKKTYRENFPNDEHDIDGDITKVDAADIPDHDVLLAGFPCQPFSIAGVSKKNALGRPHGFECTTQGTLFFDVARIIAEKRPKAFLLENVKNLVSHDGGNTFRVIKETLSRELGYHVQAKVIDGQSFTPQHRERILIVGFREATGFSFDDFRKPEKGPVLGSILHPEDGSEAEETPFTTGPLAKVHAKYVLTEKLWEYLQNYAAKHKAAGNGFGFGLVTPDMTTRTLSARYYKDGSEILVSRGGRKRPRRLTPRECARLMGFDAPGIVDKDRFIIPVSDTQAYKQFGNSVVVPVIREVARLMAPHIRILQQYEETGILELPLFADAG